MSRVSRRTWPPKNRSLGKTNAKRSAALRHRAAIASRKCRSKLMHYPGSSEQSSKRSFISKTPALYSSVRRRSLTERGRAHGHCPLGTTGVSTGRDRDGEHGDFSSFLPWPTKWQSSAQPVRSGPGLPGTKPRGRRCHHAIKTREKTP